MPVTDLSGGDDWLQQFLAGHAAAQAFGASQPYGPGAVPGPYSGGPQGLMPGGGVTNRQQSTPGAPSMGYPAMGQGQAQSPPAPPPGPAQGLSLTNNPVMNALQSLNPIGSANASVLHPNLVHPNLSNPMGLRPAAPSPSPLLRAGAADSLPLAFGNPTSQDYQDWLKLQLAQSPPAATTTAPPAGADPNAPDPIGDYVSRVGNYPSWPTTAPRGAVVGSPGPSIANAPLPPRRPSSFGGQTPGAGAPQGQPSQTPRPPKSASSRFGTVQYQVPGAGPLSRSPIYTALNLFGRS